MLKRMHRTKFLSFIFLFLFLSLNYHLFPALSLSFLPNVHTYTHYLAISLFACRILYIYIILAQLFCYYKSEKKQKRYFYVR